MDNDSDKPENKQLAVVAYNTPSVINLTRIHLEGDELYKYDVDDDNDNGNEDNNEPNSYHHQRLYKPKSLIDYSWSRKILELVGNKAKLVESFSWLSTVGGGFSALGEKDSNFSMRAGSLSLGQQLHLAEQLGDDRLKVMCHLFAALAALQLENKLFCYNYMRRVAVPLLLALPYRDPILMNMVKHIFFRLSVGNSRNRKGMVMNAIKDKI